MHTSTFKTEGGKFTVHHNGDYSGDVKIMIPTYHPKISFGTRVTFHDMKGQRERYEKLLHTDEDLMPDHYEVDIPFDLLKQIVAEAVLNDLISKLEQMTSDEILNYVSSKDVLTLSWLERQDRDS